MARRTVYYKQPRAREGGLLGATSGTRAQYERPVITPFKMPTFASPGAAPARPAARTGAPPRPGGRSDQQRAEALVAALLAPQSANAHANYKQQLESGLSGIRNLTSGIIGEVTPFDARLADLYKGAEGRQGAVDDSMRAALLAGGQHAASDIGGKLAAISSPGAGPLAAGQAQIGAGAGNALMGIGSAELSRLLANETSDRAYVDKQPGILGGLGIQAGGKLTTSLATALNDALAKIDEQRPGLVQNEVGRMSSAKLAQQKLDQQGAIAVDRSNQAWAKIKQGGANADDLRAYRQDLLTLKQQGLISNDQYRSQSLYLKQRGQDITSADRRRGQDMTAAGKGAKGGLTALQQRTLASNAATDAADAWNGVTDKNGKQVSPAKLSYQKALNAMLGHYPLEIAIEALDRYYPRGQNGRPWLSITERRALIAAGASPDAVRMGQNNGQTAQQLLQHYKIPPGGGTANPSQAGGAGVAYPLGTHSSTLIGRPYQGTHTLYGNWESDNAIDIPAAAGTPVYAVADGEIGSQLGSLGKGGNLAGNRVHLVTGGNEFYYAHLASYVVKAGQRVRKGQLIGYTGALNHLHIASKRGNPVDIFGYGKGGQV